MQTAKLIKANERPAQPQPTRKAKPTTKLVITSNVKTAEVARQTWEMLFAKGETK